MLLIYGVNSALKQSMKEWIKLPEEKRTMSAVSNHKLPLEMKHRRSDESEIMKSGLNFITVKLSPESWCSIGLL